MALLRIQLHVRGSTFCWALSFSRCFSIATLCWSTSFSSSTKNPPFELTILDKSYSKYFPSRASLLSGLGTVGDPEDAVTSTGRLLLGFRASEDEEAAASFCHCRALADSTLIQCGHDGRQSSKRYLSVGLFALSFALPPSSDLLRLRPLDLAEWLADLGQRTS